MKIITTSLEHKILPPRASNGRPAPALVMLHGRGANEEDLLGLADYLDDRFFIAAARAPLRFEGSGGYAWYDLLGVGHPEPKSFGEGYQRLSAFLRDMVNGYPVDPTLVFLLGFSMGSMMSYAISLTQPEHVAGIVANSGYIPEESGLTFHWRAVQGKPFFVAHGTEDAVIPVQLARRAQKLLGEANVRLTYREYPMGHEISEQSLDDISRWLSAQLDAKISGGSANDPSSHHG